MKTTKIKNMKTTSIMEDGVDKPWYKSKTFWFGALQVVSGIVTALEANVAAGVALTGLGVVTIILRVLTTTPLQPVTGVKK